MSDPTQAMPAADGPGAPGGPGGPGGPGEPMDRRKVAIIVMTVVIILLLILLAVVATGDDDDGDDAAATSTTESTTTTEATTTTEVTTTTEAPTSTTESTTTTSAAPQQTIPPERCTGDTSPDEPEPVAVVFYDAWRAGDRTCAENVANQDAIDTLFANDGADADWTFQGCFESDDPEPKIDCAHTYPGGSAHFEMQYGALAGWQIVAVDFVAD